MNAQVVPPTTTTTTVTATTGGIAAKSKRIFIYEQLTISFIIIWDGKHGLGIGRVREAEQSRAKNREPMR